MILLSSGAFIPIDLDRSELFFVRQAYTSMVSFPHKRESRNTLDAPVSSTGQAYQVRHDRFGETIAGSIEEIAS